MPARFSRRQCARGLASFPNVLRRCRSRYPRKTREKLKDRQEVDASLAAILGGTEARALESETLDFKTESRRSRKDTLRDHAEACACTANARGGAVIVGVADAIGGTAAFVGCALEPMLVKRRMFEKTDPPLVVSEELFVGGHRVVVLGVPSSADVHAVSGRCSERVETSCEPMSPQRIASLLGDRRMDDWSARDSGLALDAFEPDAVRVARGLLERSEDPAGRAFARLPESDLLRRLGVVTDRGALTNGGALLFARAARAGAAHGGSGAPWQRRLPGWVCRDGSAPMHSPASHGTAAVHSGRSANATGVSVEYPQAVTSLSFLRPPVIEVAIGIEFVTPAPLAVQSVFDLREILGGAYPRVELQPPLPPLPPLGVSGTFLGLQFGGPPHRWWFLSGDDSRLIQLQQDRLLLNWRRTARDSVYPRFHSLLPEFLDLAGQRRCGRGEPADPVAADRLLQPRWRPEPGQRTVG